MAAAPIGLYVYFRSHAPDAAVLDALDRASALLSRAGWPKPSLWRRPAMSPGARTWMQVHPPEPAQRIEALLGALERSSIDSGLASLIDGSWHVERFEPCDR